MNFSFFYKNLKMLKNIYIRKAQNCLLMIECKNCMKGLENDEIFINIF